MKLMRIEITPEFLMDLILGKAKSFDFIEPKYLPDDIRVVSIERLNYSTEVYNMYNLIVESNKFKDLKEGDIIPNLTLTLREK